MEASGSPDSLISIYHTIRSHIHITRLLSLLGDIATSSKRFIEMITSLILMKPELVQSAFGAYALVKNAYSVRLSIRMIQLDIRWSILIISDTGKSYKSISFLPKR